MKISLKPLKGDQFEVEITPEQTVEELKKLIAQTRSEFPADQQKLIYSGKILNDAQTIQETGVKEDGFIVVMVTKAKPAVAPAPAPAAQAATPAAAPAGPPSATPEAAPAAGGADVPMVDQATAAVANEGTVAQLMAMGFEQAQVERCLRAAFGNPDRAVEYLFSGIPEGILEPTPAAGVPPAAAGGGAPPAGQPGGGGGNAAPFPAMGGASPFPAIPTGGGAGGGAGGGGVSGPLAELRNHPRFNELAQMVAANPAMLAQLMPALEQSNPELVQAIRQNPGELLQLFQEAVGGAPQQPQDPVAAMLAAAQQAQGGGGAPGAGGAPPPGATVVRLSEAERAAVDRLAALGFDTQMALQAYLACDKNEELAANFLFDQPMED